MHHAVKLSFAGRSGRCQPTPVPCPPLAHNVQVFGVLRTQCLRILRREENSAEPAHHTLWPGKGHATPVIN